MSTQTGQIPAFYSCFHKMRSDFKEQLIKIVFNVHSLENLKLYISSRPPLVVFMISVSAMAIAFLTLGYFFKIKEIKSPEMAEVQSVLTSQADSCLSSGETPRGSPDTWLWLFLFSLSEKDQHSEFYCLPSPRD